MIKNNNIQVPTWAHGYGLTSWDEDWEDIGKFEIIDEMAPIEQDEPQTNANAYDLLGALPYGVQDKPDTNAKWLENH